jgi:hypothetical protein
MTFNHEGHEVRTKNGKIVSSFVLFVTFVVRSLFLIWLRLWRAVAFASFAGDSCLTAADGADFLGDIDGHRTPGDTAAAADTTRGSELVNPGRKLVCQPLPVA